MKNGVKRKASFSESPSKLGLKVPRGPPRPKWRWFVPIERRKTQPGPVHIPPTWDPRWFNPSCIRKGKKKPPYGRSTQLYPCGQGAPPENFGGGQWRSTGGLIPWFIRRVPGPQAGGPKRGPYSGKKPVREVSREGRAFPPLDWGTNLPPALGKNLGCEVGGKIDCNRQPTPNPA